MSSDKAIIVKLREEAAIPEKRNLNTKKTLKDQRIVSGFKKNLAHMRLKFSLIKIAMKAYGNPIDGIRALHYLIQFRRQYIGNNKLRKMAYAGGKYYMNLYAPGWKGKVYEKFILSRLHQFKPVKEQVDRFSTVFVATTKRCALQCEHCYEWDNLNKKDVLSAEKLKQIVHKIQESGVSQVQFLGGEPLLKVDNLLHVLRHTDNKNTDFWVVTSGFKLTANNAKRLKKAGLTGVVVSLDHFVPEKHNAFRGFKDAYFWVEEAVKNAIRNDLVTALSICVTKEFISEQNLMTYMDLAKQLKVSFVQFLEPKPVGHYAGKDVLLQPEHILVLEDFFLKMNFDKAYNTYPMITYHGYYQRRQGCFAAGIRGMYVDTDGDINACPFCHKKTGNVLGDCFEENLERLKSQGCKNYEISVN